MDQEPYTPPHANLDVNRNVDVPEAIRKKIRYAWLAGLTSIAVTTILIIVSISGTNIMGLDASSFIDVGLMSVFTFGIYRNSRVCAILMLLLFLANKILFWYQTGSPNGLPLALVFICFYTQGVIGTFQYHSFINKNV